MKKKTKNTEITVTDNSKLSKIQVINSNSLLNAFLSGRKRTTIRAYHQDLIHFAKYLDLPSTDEGINKAASLLFSKEHGEANYLVLNYKNYMVEKGEAANTINGRLRTIRSMVKLARTLGLVNWTLDIENVKSKPYRDTKGPGLFGYRNIKEVAENRNDSKGIRDVAIMRLLYDLALRRGEVAAIDLNDINFENRILTITGKGRNEPEKRTLPEPTIKAIKSWVNIRGIQEGALFTNLDRAKKGDGRLTGTAIYYIVRGYGKKVDLTVRPHGLRHAAITEALRITNGNYQMVQAFSRHADPRTLKIYDDNLQDLGGKVAKMLAAAT